MEHPRAGKRSSPPRILSKVEETRLKQCFLTELPKVKGLRRFKYLRDIVLIELALDAGFRVGECQKFRIKDVWENMAVRNEIHLEANFNKGNVERRVAIAADLKKALELYLPLRMNPWPTNGEDAILLISKPGQRARKDHMSRTDVVWALAFWTGKAGLGHMHFHWLRHTFASRFYWGGGKDLVETQTMIGHRNLNTTRIYLHPEQDSMDKHLLESRPGQLSEIT